jgi:hypothetical protein
MSKEIVERFFKHAVVDYNRGDIKKLLDLQLPICGPLLASTVSGTDIMGGMIHGFDVGNSGKRSTAFMRDHLGMGAEDADLVYTNPPCGLTHEGVSKLLMGFFVHYDRLDRGTFIYKEKDMLWLNVTELAWSYLDAVEKVGKNIHAYLSHIPEASSKDVLIYQRALALPRKDIAQFGGLMEDKAAAGRPYRSSSSCFIAEHRLKHFKVFNPPSSP